MAALTVCNISQSVFLYYSAEKSESIHRNRQVVRNLRKCGDSIILFFYAILLRHDDDVDVGYEESDEYWPKIWFTVCGQALLCQSCGSIRIAWKLLGSAGRRRVFLNFVVVGKSFHINNISPPAETIRWKHDNKHKMETFPISALFSGVMWWRCVIDEVSEKCKFASPLGTRRRWTIS